MNEQKKEPQKILFKRIHVDAKKGTVLKLYRRERRNNELKKSLEFSCDQCDFMAKSKAGLSTHKRRKHK